MSDQMKVVEAVAGVISNIRSEMDADAWDALVVNMADAFAPIVERFDRDAFYDMCLFVDEDETFEELADDDDVDSPMYPICG